MNYADTTEIRDFVNTEENKEIVQEALSNLEDLSNENGMDSRVQNARLYSWGLITKSSMIQWEFTCWKQPRRGTWLY